jgi:hypothetical protein
MLAMAIGAVIALAVRFRRYIDDTMKLPDDVSRTMKLAVWAVAKITGETAEDKLISAKHQDISIPSVSGSRTNISSPT